MERSQASANNSVNTLPPPSPNIATPPPPASASCGENGTSNNEPLPDGFTVPLDLMADERIWKQQYHSVSKDKIGPAYKVDFSQANNTPMGLSQGQLGSAFTIVETLIRYGPHTDDYTTLVSHNTWIAMVYNFLRAATISLLRTANYTSQDNMASLWALRGHFPPPQRHAVDGDDDVWKRMAILSAVLSQHISSSIDCETNMDMYRDAFEEAIRKTTHREIEEKVATWKEARTRKAQSDLENAISTAAKNNNKQYLCSVAQEMGLTVTEPGDTTTMVRTPATPRGPSK